MVGVDCHGERGSEEIVSPFCQCADNCQEFAVVDLVVSFRFGETFQEEAYWVSASVFVELREDCSGGRFGCIGFNLEGFGRVRHS